MMAQEATWESSSKAACAPDTDQRRDLKFAVDG